MTQTGYTNAIVDTMLGWLKGLASWVLRLFNLSAGGSPLQFLANNWLKILVFLLIVGVTADVLIWLIRWRPHWVWFRKKRVIINDKNFFANEHDVDEDDDDYPRRRSNERRKPRRNWEDSEFVVPSTVVRRRDDRRTQHVKSMQLRDQEAARAEADRQHADVFQSDIFNVNAKQKFSDKYEDEVFDVDSLPKAAQNRPDPRRSGKTVVRRNPESANAPRHR